DLEGMRRFIGADSLAFLSVEGIYRAMGYEQRDPLKPQFTDHCFTGDYPTALTDQIGQEASPRQLSLLAEASGRSVILGVVHAAPAPHPSQSRLNFSDPQIMDSAA